jgi:hypothetical protein
MTEEIKRQTDIDPIFRQHINDIFDEWHANTVSFAAALKSMDALRQDALAESNEINEGAIYNILGIMYGYRSQAEAQMLII